MLSVGYKFLSEKEYIIGSLSDTEKYKEESAKLK